MVVSKDNRKQMEKNMDNEMDNSGFRNLQGLGYRHNGKSHGKEDGKLSGHLGLTAESKVPDSLACHSKEWNTAQGCRSCP